MKQELIIYVELEPCKVYIQQAELHAAPMYLTLSRTGYKIPVAARGNEVLVLSTIEGFDP